MNQIAIAGRAPALPNAGATIRTAGGARSTTPQRAAAGTRELLGVKSRTSPQAAAPQPFAGERLSGQRAPQLSGEKQSIGGPARQSPQTTGTIRATEEPEVTPTKSVQSDVAMITNEIEKTVKRLPTIYVIAFFAVVVSCAVLIIWNTLQVDRLAAERSKLDDAIAQTEQKLIRLRAEQMQLSAASRVGTIAHAKMGMVDAMSEDIVVVK